MLITIEVFYILQLSYASTLPIVKIAVLLFYHRIFPQQRFRLAVYSMGIFLILFLISNWLAFMLQCLPVRSFWKPEIPHHCFNRVAFYIANGRSNVAPGLWSAAEAEIVVMSANLPLMGPIVEYLRGKCRHSSDRTPEDEEHRGILELSAMGSKKRLTRSKNLTSAGVITTAEGSTHYGRENAGSKVPGNRIVVEMGLEQKFTGQSADSTTNA
ncbi:MAG: hypothetical protein Q9212_002633 [Teloschistes hypoglaucus]